VFGRHTGQQTKCHSEVKKSIDHAGSTEAPFQELVQSAHAHGISFRLVNVSHRGLIVDLLDDIKSEWPSGEERIELVGGSFIDDDGKFVIVFMNELARNFASSFAGVSLRYFNLESHWPGIGSMRLHNVHSQKSYLRAERCNQVTNFSELRPKWRSCVRARDYDQRFLRKIVAEKGPIRGDRIHERNFSVDNVAEA